MSNVWRRSAFGIALGTMLGVSACAPEPTDEPPRATAEPSEDPDPTPAEGPSPEPQPSPEPPIVIPECAELISMARAEERLQPGLAVTADDPGLIEVFRNALGPIALQSLDQALQEKHCTWGIPHSDGLIHVNVAELPTEVREHLVASLQESDYSETAVDGVQVFTYELPGAVVGANDIWYGFVDDVWVSSFGSGLGDLAVEGMRAANPGLDGG